MIKPTDILMEQGISEIGSNIRYTLMIKLTI